MRFVVDTSVIVAILLEEPEAEFFRELLVDHEPVITGHVVLETTIVLSGRGIESAARRIELLLEQSPYQLRDFDARMTRLAQGAFLAFGKGRHRARLNFGDCMSYAAARALDLPLLWKGDDFDLTDIERAA